MRILTKDELLNEMKLKTETVPVGEGYVIVSELGAVDYMKLWTDPQNQKASKEEGKFEIDMNKFTPALIAYCVVNSSGERMFTDSEIDDLARKGHEVFMKLAEVARRLNGMGGEETKNLKAGRKNK